MVKDIKIKTSGIAAGKFMLSKLEYKAFNNKSGSFMSCELSDTSGSIKAVMWDNTEPIKAWAKNKIVVDIVGEVSIYKDIPQVQIKTITPAKSYSPADFIPALPQKTIGDLIKRLISNIPTEPTHKKKWKLLLDGAYIEKFSTCPGGVGDVHHAYLGGLIEHTCFMVEIAKYMADTQFPNLDKNVLMTGCLLHDIGKMTCYEWDTVIQMSDEGRLLHHTHTGYILFMNMIDQLGMERSDLTILKLAHIIVSHHEDEGIKKTLLPEATAVALIDNLNASTNFSLGYVGKEESKEPDSNWTKYCQLTGRQYFIPKKPDILAPSILDDILHGH